MSDDDSGGLGWRRIIPSVIRSKLAVKFAIALLALGLVTAGLSAFATGAIVDQTRSNVDAEFTSVAADEAAKVEQWVQRNEQSTALLSRSADWRGDGHTGMQVQLQTRRSMNGMAEDVVAMHVVTTDAGSASVFASTDLSNGDPFGSLHPWFVDLSLSQSNQVEMSPLYEYQGEYRVAFVSPIGGPEGRMFVTEVSIGPIAETLTGSARSDVGLTQVVNADNDVVLSNRHGESGDPVDVNAVIGSQYASGEALDPVTQARESGEAGVIGSMSATEGIFDETYAVGYAPVDGVEGWVVTVQAPRGQVFGFVQTVATWGYGAMALSLLALLVMGAALAYHVTSPLNRLRDRADQIREGELRTDLETVRSDEIGQLFVAFDDMREEVRRKIIDAEEARQDAEIAREEAEEMAEHLQQQAEAYGSVMQECAEGDLTQRIDADSDYESMREIAEHFNEMVAELERTIGQLQEFADQVAEGGEIVRDGAESVNEASEQVATSIQTISEDIQQQRSRLEAIAEDVRDVSADLEADLEGDGDVEAHLERVQRIAEDIGDLTEFNEESMNEAENVAAAAEEQTSALHEVSRSADDLIGYAGPLGDVLNRFRTDAKQEFYFPVGPGSEDDDATSEDEIQPGGTD